MQQSGAIHWRSIPNIDHISVKQFVSDYQNRNTPVVISDSAPPWEAFKRWSPEYFAERFGDKCVAPDSGYYDSLSSSAKKIPIRLLMSELEGTSQDTPPRYLRNMDIYGQFPEITGDIEPRLPFAYPNWLACRLLPQYVPDGLVELFVGGNGAGFPTLHVDSHGSHAYITQIYGTKNAFVLPPTQTSLLTEVFGKPEDFELDSEDSRLSSLEAYRVKLKSRDTLFVPNGWWHTTTMDEPSISVSTNNVNRSNWLSFVDYVTGSAGPKATMKRAYLLALGKCLEAGATSENSVWYRSYAGPAK